MQRHQTAPSSTRTVFGVGGWLAYAFSHRPKPHWYRGHGQLPKAARRYLNPKKVAASPQPHLGRPATEFMMKLETWLEDCQSKSPCRGQLLNSPTGSHRISGGAATCPKHHFQGGICTQRDFTADLEGAILSIAHRPPLEAPCSGPSRTWKECELAAPPSPPSGPGTGVSTWVSQLSMMSTRASPGTIKLLGTIN